MSPEIVLVDTSAWLMVLGRSRIADAKQRIDELLSENRLATTPLICLELLGGTRSEGEFAELQSYLEALPRFPMKEEEWSEAARLAFDLRRNGKTVPNTDVIIATVAKRAGAVLLHADHHFDFISEVTGLAVESLIPKVKKQSSNPGS